MEDFKSLCNLIMPEKKISDVLKMNYLSHEDLKVCYYVISELPYIETESMVKGRPISLNELREKSLNEFKVFDDDIYSRVHKLISTVPIYRYYDDIFSFQCQISYADGKENGTNIINPDSGRIEYYIVPKYLFEYCIFRLAHEHMHALKETNYEEYRNAFIVGETIPMFFELLMFEPRDILRRELVKDRVSSLFGSTKDDFILADEYVQNNCCINFNFNSDNNTYQSKSVYEYIRTRTGCYLNSFYYAVILYSMYKETPKKILDFVSRVLKQEMSTLDILNCLGIYGDIKGGTFEKELGHIRKLLK